MIMTKLKEATSDQHKSLESTVNVMDSMFTIEDYKNLLVKFYIFYSAIENQLAELDWNSIGLDFAEREKTSKLESDLQLLGADVSENEAFVDLPQLKSLASGVGAMYVLEGATLGGQVIKRHLKTALDIDADSGAAFFDGYGEKTGPMWKEFGRIASEYSEKTGSDEEIIESARQTFDSLKNSFENSSAQAMPV